MKRFVLDCSVAATLCFADEKNAYVDSVREVVNVLALAERRKRLLPAETAHFFELYSSLPYAG